MPKFSIIVPVYNVEKYIKKCLDSIKNQSFKDYEVIIVNDGTQDNSMDIVNDYNFKVINQKNQGLSAARNKGVEKAKGEYLLFIDSDDYIEKDLLKEINKSLSNNPDLVRFQIKEVFENDDKTIKYNEKEFNNLNGKEAFDIITTFHFVEPAWSYAIKREYYMKEKYKFKESTYHEDFGLIPLIIIKSKIVNCISYLGYDYLQRQNSIMSNKSYEKTKKKVEDMFNHYNYLITEIDKTNIDSSTFKSFISNSLIIKVCELNKDDYKKYKKLLKENKVFDNLKEDTLKRRIKKIMFKISPKLTIKFL